MFVYSYRGILIFKDKYSYCVHDGIKLHSFSTREEAEIFIDLMLSGGV